MDGQETATYVVNGELFFDSSNDFYTPFEYPLDPDHVIIDVQASFRESTMARAPTSALILRGVDS